MSSCESLPGEKAVRETGMSAREMRYWFLEIDKQAAKNSLSRLKKVSRGTQSLR